MHGGVVFQDESENDFSFFLFSEGDSSQFGSSVK